MTVQTEVITDEENDGKTINIMFFVKREKIVKLKLQKQRHGFPINSTTNRTVTNYGIYIKSLHTWLRAEVQHSQKNSQ